MAITYIGVPQRVEVATISQDSRAMARGSMAKLPSGRSRSEGKRLAIVARYNKRHYGRTRVWRG